MPADKKMCELPRDFEQVTKHGKKYFFTTEELLSLYVLLYFIGFIYLISIKERKK